MRIGNKYNLQITFEDIILKDTYIKWCCSDFCVGVIRIQKKI